MRKILLSFMIVFGIFVSFCEKHCFADEPDNVLLRGEIYFELEKSSLNAESIKVLKQITSLLKIYRDNLVAIEGHADSTGEKGYNRILSQKRAQSVYDFFINNGIDAARIKIYPCGDDRPIEDNFTDEGRALNRRAEIIVFKNKK